MTQDKKKEILFFDQFVEKKNKYIGLADKAYDRLFTELSKSLTNTKKEIKIVDLGCGTGTFTKKLSSISNNVYGCDISPKSVKLAKNFYPEINFSIEDIENLSFKNDFFDVVILSGVLHHFDNFYKPLKEAKRILKNGGLLFSYDPNLNNPFFWIYRRKKSWFYSNEGVTDNEEPLTIDKIKNVMKSCDFKDIEVYGISNMPYEYIENKKLSLLLPLYNFIDRCLDIVPFVKKIIGSFLITKVKK